MAKVDIIIPAYNSAKYLPQAITSVVAQTFEDWKILLVDDGSTDNTAEVVSPFLEALGEKIQYIKQSNGGLPAARNTAIRNSSAEFLALLDADDVWLPSRLLESLKCFESRPQVGLSYGFISRINQSSELIDTWEGNKKYACGNIASSIYMLKVNLPCPTITFRRKCIEEVGVFDESLRATEDRDLWLRIAQRYEVGLASAVIAYYRTSAGSMSTDPERMLNAQLQFIRKHYGSVGCGLMNRQAAMARAYKQYADALKLRNQMWAAMKSSLRALTFFPLDAVNIKTTVSVFLSCIGIRRNPH